MEESHGSGTVRTLSLIVLTLALVAMITLSCGSHPQGNGITWDNTAEIERNRTQQVEIVETNQTERTRIAADKEKSIAWANAMRDGFIVGVIAAGIAVGVWAWSRRPHKPVPPVPTVLLQHYPGHVAELIDGEWAIVNPQTGVYVTEPDAWREVRMLETR